MLHIPITTMPLGGIGSRMPHAANMFMIYYEEPRLWYYGMCRKYSSFVCFFGLCHVFEFGFDMVEQHQCRDHFNSVDQNCICEIREPRLQIRGVPGYCGLCLLILFADSDVR